MQTEAFIQLIEKHPKKLLRFRDHQEDLVHPSYHVSEVKTAVFETVDCGAMTHRWTETILQLWLSGDPDSERAMEAGKVAKILDKVSRQIRVNPDAELRVEYGNDAFPPVVFHIGKVDVQDQEIVVFLRPPVLQCKLEERGGSCTGPEESTKKEKGGSCCSGTGCC